MKRIPSLAFLAAFCLSISAADLYVSLSTGNNKNDGKTPATALKNIFKALDICEAGDVIHVAERLRTLNLPQPTKGASLAPWMQIGRAHV